MDFISSLFGTAGTAYQGYTAQKTAEANKKAAEKTAAAQTASTRSIMETLQKATPWLIGGVIGLVALLFFVRK